MDDDLDGYSSVTVAVSKDFYPKAHATLDDASRVEGDDMRVYPMGGTDYYPYVYLGVRPYGSQEEHEPVGKDFEGRSTEYTVSIFLDLIDVETGESATGYPQQVAPTQANFSILSGGWARIKAWSVTANASQVSITIERFNSTYTKPVESTYTSVSVTPQDALQSYLNTSYYIAVGMINRVTYVGTKHSTSTAYQYTGENLNDIVGMRIYTGSSAAGQPSWMTPGLYVTPMVCQPYYYLNLGTEPVPANSSKDVYTTYNYTQMQQMTISEALIENVEQYGGQSIFDIQDVSEFAFIYNYPPSSQE